MKQDRTTSALEKAAVRVQRAMELMEQAIPFGPGNIEMQPHEIRDRLQHARANEFAAIVSQLGMDKIMEITKNGK